MLNLFTALLLAGYANAGVLIYQGASATLTTTPSLVTYTTKLTPLATPQMVLTSSVEDPTPRNVNIAPSPEDDGYVNGIYTCAAQGSYSVGASLAITGTLGILSELRLAVELSTNGGSSWTALRSVPVAIPLNTGRGSAYLAFVVPCPQGGKIRITASTSVLLPVISTTPSDNALSISKIY